MDYRLAIGLPPFAEFERPGKIVQLGEFIDSVADWDVFVTVTFRQKIRRWKNPAGFAQVETVVVRGADQKATLCSRDLTTCRISQTPTAPYVSRVFVRWIEGLTEKLSNRVDYFVGFEAGTQSGANHFHALVAGDGLRDYSRSELWQELFKTAGRSLVLPFDPGRGAAWYLAAAYAGKTQLGWDVSVGNRPLIERRPARGGGQDLAFSPAMPRRRFHSTLQRWHR